MTVLFHHQVSVAVLGSGSRGNATYIGNGRSGLLIDCGLSTRQVYRRLDALGLGDAPIDAVLITHEHTDHVGAAAVLGRRVKKETGRDLPFFMTRGTAYGVHPSSRPAHIQRVEPNQPFQLGAWQIEPFTVPHDTTDPVAYTIEHAGVRVGVITDLGRSTRLVERQLASMDIAVLEFNHDAQMLMDGDYPWRLKQRVKGPHGHLSNLQASQLLHTAASAGRLEHVVLAHLSEDNNRPEKALAAALTALHGAGARQTRVEVASQDEPLDPMRVACTPAPTRRRVRPRRSAPRRDAAPAHEQMSLFG